MPDDTARDGEGGGKWTVGPYHRDGLTVYALQESGNRRVPMVNRWCAHVQTAPGTPEAELVAVAALFQAAPDMAEALREIVRGTCEGFCKDYPPGYYEEEMSIDCGACKARTALAKARGEDA